MLVLDEDGRHLHVPADGGFRGAVMSGLTRPWAGFPWLKSRSSGSAFPTGPRQRSRRAVVRDERLSPTSGHERCEATGTGRGSRCSSNDGGRRSSQRHIRGPAARLPPTAGALTDSARPLARAGLVRPAGKPPRMSSRGQSLSMFVVQRTFSCVRRGYDPDEVDRHLELVSQWFTSTDIGRTFMHERSRLQERERAVSAMEAEQARGLEGARPEADATLEGARRRADAEARAADRTLAAAQEEAAATASSVWPRSGPRRRNLPSACERKPTRSCRSTRTAGVGRPTGSPRPPATSTRLRRCSPRRPASAGRTNAPGVAGDVALASRPTRQAEPPRRPAGAAGGLVALGLIGCDESKAGRARKLERAS